jgi:agmatine/peptidylarginine deiminase
MNKFLVLFFVLSSAFAYAGDDTDHRVNPVTQTTTQPSREEYARDTLFTPGEFAKVSELQMSKTTFEKIAKQAAGTLDQVVDFRVIVRSESEANYLREKFKSYGGNVDRLYTSVINYDSIWYQDYGPIYSVDATGELVANDFIYNRYGRVNDDKVPVKIAAIEQTSLRKVTMNYEGGNFVSDGHGTCFASTRMYQQNPQLNANQVNELMRANLGCENLVALKPLENDITYHIDLFAKLVDYHTFFVGDFIDQPTNKKIMDENAKTLESLGYKVERIKVRSTSASNHRTHINTFLVNGYAIMPTYGIPEDDLSAHAYEAMGFKVLRIKSNDLEGQGGAIHCIMRSKPQL